MAICCQNDSLLTTTDSIGPVDQDVLNSSLGNLGLPWSATPRDSANAAPKPPRRFAPTDENQPPLDNLDRLAAMRFATKQAAVLEKVVSPAPKSNTPCRAPLNRAAAPQLRNCPSNIVNRGFAERTASGSFRQPCNRSLSFAQNAWVSGSYSTSFRQVATAVSPRPSVSPRASPRCVSRSGEDSRATLAQTLFGGTPRKSVAVHSSSFAVPSFRLMPSESQHAGVIAATSPCSSFAQASLSRSLRTTTASGGSMASPQAVYRDTSDFDIPADLPENAMIEMVEEIRRPTPAPAFMSRVSRSPPSISREASFTNSTATPAVAPMFPHASKEPTFGRQPLVQQRSKSRKPEIRQPRSRHPSLQKPPKKDSRRSRSASLFWNPPPEAQPVCEAAKPPSFLIHAVPQSGLNRPDDSDQRPIATVVAAVQSPFSAQPALPLNYRPPGPPGGSFVPPSPQRPASMNFAAASPHGSFAPPARIQAVASFTRPPSPGSFRMR